MISGQSDWSTQPAKFLYSLEDRRVGARVGLPLLSVSIRRGVVPRSELTDKVARADDLGNYKLCEPEDVVINRMSAYQGAIGLSRIEGIVSPEYLVLRSAPGVDPRYLCYIVKSSWFVGEMTSRLRGIGSVEQGNVRTPRINPEDLGRIAVPTPPTATQMCIADYLDTETTRIDALIAMKQRMIGLLSAARQAAIDGSLTGCGRRARVRHLIRRITSGPRGWADLVSDEGTLFLRIANVSATSIELDMRNIVHVEAPRSRERERTAVRAGDVLVSITAEIGSVGVARQEHAGAAISQHLALLTPTQCSGDWLGLSLTTTAAKAQLDARSYGGTKTQLALDDVRDVEIEIVDHETEQEILTLLASRLICLRATAAAISRQIELLVEHRQAIITAAVTGELDIPGVAA